MTQKNAARIYKDVQQAEAERQRQKALSEPENFIKLAAAQGYNFSLENLETQLSQLSDEEVAGIFNPGIPPRRHLYPK
jgi:predicted ribosomally synthesized peptide with nif11-like leader